MKISIKKLKSLIKEVVETEHRIEGTRSELRSIISKLPKGSISTKEYTDSDTGEIYLEPGDVIDRFFELTKEKPKLQIHDEFEDVNYFELLSDAIDELITDYDNISYDAISDYALNVQALLYINNPNVDEWLDHLDLTKRDLFDMIKDRVAEQLNG